MANWQKIWLCIFFFFLQDPLPLDHCVICCEQDWDDCFEIQEFVSKESYVFKVIFYFLFDIKFIRLQGIFSLFFKLRWLNQLRPKICLKSDSNHLLIDFFWANLVLRIQMVATKSIKSFPISIKKFVTRSKMVNNDRKRLKEVQKVNLYQFFRLNLTFMIFLSTFQSFNWLWLTLSWDFLFFLLTFLTF